MTLFLCRTDPFQQKITPRPLLCPLNLRGSTGIDYGEKKLKLLILAFCVTWFNTLDPNTQRTEKEKLPSVTHNVRNWKSSVSLNKQSAGQVRRKNLTSNVTKCVLSGRLFGREDSV